MRIISGSLYCVVIQNGFDVYVVVGNLVIYVVVVRFLYEYVLSMNVCVFILFMLQLFKCLEQVFFSYVVLFIWF